MTYYVKAPTHNYFCEVCQTIEAAKERAEWLSYGHAERPQHVLVGQMLDDKAQLPMYIYFHKRQYALVDKD